MAATKDQERKALEKIKKIVEELGGDSYIGMAFEGCFEIAERNIEDDFGCSMKQRAEKAQKDAEYFQQAANNFSAEVEKLQKENEKLRTELGEAKAKAMDKDVYVEVYNIITDQQDKAEKDIMEAARKIAVFGDGTDARNNAIDSMRGLVGRKERLDKVVKKLEAMEP
jgi:regulator of replication initiation timing